MFPEHSGPVDGRGPDYEERSLPKRGRDDAHAATVTALVAGWKLEGRY